MPGDRWMALARNTAERHEQAPETLAYPNRRYIMNPLNPDENTLDENGAGTIGQVAVAATGNIYLT